MFSSDDKIVTRLGWRGTHTGSYAGIKATGKRVQVPDFAGLVALGWTGLAWGRKAARTCTGRCEPRSRPGLRCRTPGAAVPPNDHGRR
jgi:hypothetical protein